MTFRLKRYRKDFEHSYSFGVFPTLELLTHRPQDCLQVVVHPKGQENAGIAKIQAICAERGIPLEIQEKVFARINARAKDLAIGVFRKIETGLDAAANHVILVNPSGMGNLGTIIRTMLGFGFQDLAIVLPAADIFHPEVIRASMGALFQLQFQYFSDFDSYHRKFPRRYYPLLTDGAAPLPETDFEPPFGVIFGNESSGLSPAYQEIGTSVRIPQSDAINSLNLGISVGVVLYQIRAKHSPLT
jgi:RNA methyltransferase, TrmH family